MITCMEEQRETLSSKGKMSRRRRQNASKTVMGIAVAIIVLLLVTTIYFYRLYVLEFNYRMRHISVPIRVKKMYKYPATEKNTRVSLIDPRVSLDLKPLEPGEGSLVKYSIDGIMQPTVWDPYLLRIGLPDRLVPSLLDFLDDTGLADWIARMSLGGPLVNGQWQNAQLKGIDHYKETDDTIIVRNKVSTWEAHQPPAHVDSNMHWIAPADESTHDQFLAALGSGGFDVVFEALAETYPSLTEMTALQLTFLCQAYSDATPYMHHDFIDVHGKLFNIYIPLITVEGTEPELLVRTHNEGRHFAGLPLEHNVAAVIGDNTIHGTNDLDYTKFGKYRLAATIHVAEVDHQNVGAAIKTFTQHFPPGNRDYVMKQRGRHYRRADTEGKHALPKRVL